VIEPAFLPVSLSRVRCVAKRQEANMSPDDNKGLIRRYIQAIDDNQAPDW